MKQESSDHFLLLKIVDKESSSVKVSRGANEVDLIVLMIPELQKPLFKGAVAVDTEKKLVQVVKDGTNLADFSEWLDKRVPGWQEEAFIGPSVA